MSATEKQRTATAVSYTHLDVYKRQVQARQSLWEIAVAAYPDRDPREVMDDIAELNGLRPSQL